MSKTAHDISADPDYRDLGPTIEQARERAGLSKAELGKRVGLSRQSIVQIENGARRVDVIEFVRIAEVLGVERGDFLYSATGSVGHMQKDAEPAMRSADMSVEEELLALT